MAVDHREFAEAESAYVEAAAGCGKTQLIVKAVEYLAENGASRQLILTHTHAGVAALRARLKQRGVLPDSYRLETIDAFAHRWATAYPLTSGFTALRPRETEEWDALRPAAERVVRVGPIADVLKRSYGGVFVDEYQDCTLDQHQMILALHEVLPVRVVGDPLQGIFDFGGSALVDLEDGGQRVFPYIGELTEPHRWIDHNPDLGVWLVEARGRIQKGDPLPDPGGVVRVVDGGDPAWIGACKTLLGGSAEQTVVVIRKHPSQAHALAKKLDGAYQSMEEIEAKDLLKHADSIEGASGRERALAVVEFAGECMTSKKPIASIRDRLKAGEDPRPQKTDRKRIVEALGRVEGSDDLAPVADALITIRESPETHFHRRELLDAMIAAIRSHVVSQAASLVDTAWEVRQRARFGGRRAPRLAVSRTLLIKGLEFDHAVVMVDDFNNDPKNLYVAITRGSRTLTLLRR